MKILPKLRTGHEAADAAIQRFSSPTESGEALDKLAIAELITAAIEQMTCDELARLIRATDLPTALRPDLERRLPHYDHETLRRMAYLARRCCQNRGY